MGGGGAVGLWFIYADQNHHCFNKEGSHEKLPLATPPERPCSLCLVGVTPSPQNLSPCLSLSTPSDNWGIGQLMDYWHML